MAELEIRGTEVPSYSEEPIAVQVAVANDRHAPKHVAGAYVVTEKGPVRVPGGRALLVEEGSELKLAVGYTAPYPNVGFGVKLNDGAGTFVNELYFPYEPLDGWAYGWVDRDDDGRALEMKSRLTIERLSTTPGSAVKSWALTVTIWPILEWEDRDGRYGVDLDVPAPSTSRRSSVLDAGGIMSGRAIGRTVSGRHMRIIRSAIDEASPGGHASHRVFDVRMYLFIASAEMLGRPVVQPSA